MDEFPNHPNMVQCAMNHRLYTDSSHGIWDDGEWISWDYINDHIEKVELLAEYPGASIEAIEAFEDLLDATRRYHAATGRFLEIWGELGELYAELKLGVKRHVAYQAGSDGVLDGELVEIKTLAPTRRGDRVSVKKAGDFAKLIVVKISETLQFEIRIVDRSNLHPSHGAVLLTRWADHAPIDADPSCSQNRWQRVMEAATETFDED